MKLKKTKKILRQQARQALERAIELIDTVLELDTEERHPVQILKGPDDERS